jgi:vesicle transport protein SEC22
MVLVTYIARLSDGLMLVSSYTPSQEMERYVNYGRRLVQQLSYDSPALCTVDADPFTFHYRIAQGIVYLALTPKAYPKKLAFVFLDEVLHAFVSFLQQQVGPNWEATVRQLDRPYVYIQFDRTLVQMRREYADPQSSRSLQKLNSEIQDVQNIMRTGLQDMMVRGERLDDLNDRVGGLRDTSKEFAANARRLNILAMWRKYAPLIVGALVIIVFLYIRFYWM